MNLITAFLVIILIFILAYGLYRLYLWILRKRHANLVETSEINENRRTSQIIDVREMPEFEANHILGARNIPFSQFKMRFQEIRKDQPIYLYDDHLNYAPRAAKMLAKNGYSNINILKGGFENWYGKTKSNIK